MGTEENGGHCTIDLGVRPGRVLLVERGALEGASEVEELAGGAQALGRGLSLEDGGLGGHRANQWISESVRTEEFGRAERRSQISDFRFQRACSCREAAVQGGEDFVKAPGVGRARLHRSQATGDFIVPSRLNFGGKVLILLGQIEENSGQGQAMGRREFQSVFG